MHVQEVLGDQAADIDVICADSEVGVASPDDGGGAFGADHHIDLRVARPKAIEPRDQPAHRQGMGQRDRDLSRLGQQSDFERAAAQLQIGRLERRLTGPPGLRQPHALGGSLEKLTADKGCEGLNATGKGGRRDGAALCGHPKIRRPGRLDDGLDGFESGNSPGHAVGSAHAWNGWNLGPGLNDFVTARPRDRGRSVDPRRSPLSVSGRLRRRAVLDHTGNPKPSSAFSQVAPGALRC